jgi:hypothetical protein
MPIDYSVPEMGKSWFFQVNSSLQNTKSPVRSSHCFSFKIWLCINLLKNIYISYICNVFLDILTICCQKIKPLWDNILSTDDDITGAVNISCRLSARAGERVGIIFIFHPQPTPGRTCTIIYLRDRIRWLTERKTLVYCLHKRP